MPSGIQAVRGHRKPPQRGAEIAQPLALKQLRQEQQAEGSFWVGAKRDGFTAKAAEKFNKESGAEAQMAGNIIYANVVRHGQME